MKNTPLKVEGRITGKYRISPITFDFFHTTFTYYSKYFLDKFYEILKAGS